MLNLIHPNKIAWKLIAALVVFSSFITIITTGFQLYTEYGRDIDAVETRFNQVEKSYTKSISENVWESDTGRLNLLVGGIIEFPNFIRAQVRDETGRVLAAQGDITDDNIITRSYPLSYTFRGTLQAIGVLEITVGLSEIYGRVFDRVWLILISNGIKTSLVAIFMYMLVYWLLTRHLDVIAEATRGFDFSKKPLRVAVERGRFLSQHDELDQLTDAFNDMQTKLYESYVELRTLNDELESRVIQRTEALREKIEEHKRAEARLAESEARLRDIAEAGSDWMWEMGPDLHFTYLSNSVEGRGALRINDIIGRHRSEFVEDKLDETWVRHMDDLQNHRPFQDFCYLMTKEDGDIAHIRTSGKPVFDDKGEFTGYRGIGTNISKQVETEALMLKTSEEVRVLSSAIEQNPSMVFITNNTGHIEYVNNTFIRMTGYEANEVIGENPRLLKSADTPHQVHKEIWENITTGKSWRGEIKDTRKDGAEFWAYATIAPIKNESGEITHFVATHEDISGRKEAEQQLREATKRAELANRAKTELLANMSHELRTPLNAIIGFSQTILGQIFGPLGNDKYMEYAGDINASGNHLLELINDILDVSAIESGKVQLQETELSFARLATSSLRLVSPRAKEGDVSLITDIPPDLPDLYVDERRLKQILLNLLSNAVKFTEAGGAATLSADLDDDGGIRITVKDNGIGMNEEEIVTAMTEFGQIDGGLDRKEEGTGLGLPLTKSIVELHGGTFSISSEKGVGTVATVCLPPERVVRCA